MLQESRGEMSFVSYGTHISNIDVEPHDILAPLFLQMENITEPYDILTQLGYNIDMASKIIHHTGHRPLPVAHNALNSWSTYWHNVGALFSDWDFSDGSNNTLDQAVSHFNVRGLVKSGYNEKVFHRLPFEAYETPIVQPSLTFSCSIAPGSRPLIYQSGLSGDCPTAALFSFATSLTELVNNGAFDDTTGPYTVSVMYYNVTVQDRFVRYIDYALRIYDFSNPTWYETKIITYRIRFNYSINYPLVDSDVTYPVTDLVTWTATYSANELWSSHYVPGYEPECTLSLWPFDYDEWSWANLTHQTLDVPSYFSTKFPLDFSAYIGFKENGYYVSNGRNHCYSNFHSFVSNIAKDCYPAVFFSSKKAVDDTFLTVTSNHIETIAELRDILSVLDLVRAVRNLKKGPKAFLRLLDLLADARLCYSFGIAPTISDAKDVAKKMPRFIDVFKALSTFRTTYGEYEFPIPDGFYPVFDGAQVVARSKLRLRVNPDSFLTMLLPVRSLGLLPSFSALWDLVPFSFVADWFFNIGSNTEAIESNLLYLFLDVLESTHSISILYELDTVELRTLGIDVIDGPSPYSRACYQYYERFLLGGVPVMASSRLPLYSADGVPSWSTFAALVYRLFGS